ncbi:MAG: type II toxin-antitoxin system HicA family toxin [Turicibacter sp.]|nr:type II toxin-antitoxin system HicA family toxin [Turicibacter sp.]
MASVEKIVDKMKRQPHGIKYEEAKKVLENNGYKITSQKGSHRSFRDAAGDLVTIKEETPLNKHYIKKILARIKP